MKALIAFLALVLLAANVHADCNVGAAGYVPCPPGYCTTRSGPDAFVISAANQAAVLANLCPGAFIEVYGNKSFPGGYATFDYTFVVNNSGGAIFQYMEVDNDQTLPKGDPTLQSVGGSANFVNMGAPVYVIWGSHWR
jgi:hypothetical protein